MDVNAVDWKQIEKLLTEKLIIDVLGRIGLAILAVLLGVIVVRWFDRIIQSGMSRFIDLRLVNAEGQRDARAEVRKHTLTGIAHHAMMWVGYLIIALMSLRIIGLDITPFLATAGVASLAVGFGAQNLVKDVISGFFIILEDQYGQGDSVDLDGDEGIVENLNLRTTHLRNAQGTLIVKTNGSIGVVRNMTKDWARIDFRIGVAYNSDLDKVLSVMADEGHKLKRDFSELVLEDPQVLGLESFNESDLTVRMWLRIRPGEQFNLRRELNIRIKKAFDREGIEIPFPQRTLWTQPPRTS